MAKNRVNVSMDSGLYEQAQEEEVNISAAAQAGVADKLHNQSYFFINTNDDQLPGVDGTRVYDCGVAATFGPGEYGETLERISPGDIVLSYVTDSGVCAAGQCVASWSGRGIVTPDETPPRRDRKETTIAETDAEAGDSPVEIVRGERIFPECSTIEYHLPVRWTAVLDTENAVPADVLRVFELGHPRSAVVEPQKGRPDLLTELVVGRTSSSLV